MLNIHCVFVSYQDAETVLMTPNDYQFTHGWMMVRDKEGIVVQVMACNDAHVVLMDIPGEGTKAYQVIIGGWKNTRSVIRDRFMGDIRVDVKTPGILSCNESRSFWLTWHNGNFRVGTGDVYNADTFMEWKDPSPREIWAVGVASGWGAKATWRIEEPASRKYLRILMFLLSICNMS